MKAIPCKTNKCIKFPVCKSKEILDCDLMYEWIRQVRLSVWNKRKVLEKEFPGINARKSLTLDNNYMRPHYGHIIKRDSK